MVLLNTIVALRWKYTYYLKLDIVVSKVPAQKVVETAKKVLYTGGIGDGKIFVYDV